MKDTGKLTLGKAKPAPYLALSVVLRNLTKTRCFFAMQSSFDSMVICIYAAYFRICKLKYILQRSVFRERLPQVLSGALYGIT